MNLNSLITARPASGSASEAACSASSRAVSAGPPRSTTTPSSARSRPTSSARGGVTRARCRSRWPRASSGCAARSSRIGGRGGRGARRGAIDGVTRVENLLRVAKPARKPKAQKRPAPKVSERPKPAAATAPPPEAKPVEPATPPPAAQEERPVTRRFNAEETPAEAEPSPAELAERGEGRQPAPFGATSPAGEGGSPPAPFPSGVANGTGDDERSSLPRRPRASRLRAQRAWPGGRSGIRPSAPAYPRLMPVDDPGRIESRSRRSSAGCAWSPPTAARSAR